MEYKECEMPACSQQTDIQHIKTDISEIKTALLGSEFSGGIGFIKRLVAVEKGYNQMKGKIIYLSGASSVAGFFLGLFIEKLIK